MNIIWALPTVLVGLVALVLVAVSLSIAGIPFVWAGPLPFPESCSYGPSRFLSQ